MTPRGPQQPRQKIEGHHRALVQFIKSTEGQLPELMVKHPERGQRRGSASAIAPGGPPYGRNPPRRHSRGAEAGVRAGVWDFEYLGRNRVPIDVSRVFAGLAIELQERRRSPLARTEDPGGTHCLHEQLVQRRWAYPPRRYAQFLLDAVGGNNPNHFQFFKDGTQPGTFSCSTIIVRARPPIPPDRRGFARWFGFLEPRIIQRRLVAVSSAAIAVSRVTARSPPAQSRHRLRHLLPWGALPRGPPAPAARRARHVCCCTGRFGRSRAIVASLGISAPVIESLIHHRPLVANNRRMIYKEFQTRGWRMPTGNHKHPYPRRA